MDPAIHNQLLMKVVVGAAWADGHLEPSEIQYLETLLERYGFDRDPVLRTMLEKPVSLDETEHWMIEFLAGASEADRMKLLGAIGNLLIADDNVSPEEHQLLDDYHTFMANIPAQSEVTPNLVSAVSQFFKKVAKGVG